MAPMEGEETNMIDLNQFIDGIDDITDPSSMDKILEFVEQVEEEDEKFFETLTEKLQGEIVDWEQPWYQQTNQLTRTLKNTENNDIIFRRDAICTEERDLIDKNWRKFRKKYHVPDKIICLARWKNKNKPKNPNRCPEEQARRFATAFLARGLERNTYQVFKHIRTHYGGYRRGFFNETEQKIIDICMHHKPRMVRHVLSTVLGRQQRGVDKRLNFIINGKPEKKRLKWNLPLASKFLQLLLKYSELELDELKNRKIDSQIWHLIEKDMEQSACHLQRFWYCYLHVQLFVRCDVKLSKLKKKLFKKLKEKVRDNTYRVWSDIRWSEIAAEFPDGFTPRFLYKTCVRCINSYKEYLRVPLERVVEYAFDKINNPFVKNYRNRRLKTLRLNKEGQLEPVDYIIKNRKNK